MEKKSKEQLIHELGEMQRRITQMKRSETERKRTEEALRVSENKYRTLLENLPQKIFLKDKDSVYLSCNQNYARDLKIEPDKIVGKTDYDFYPKELAEKYRADDKRIMGSGKTEDIEERYIQDGQEVFVHTVKTPVKDEQGNPIGLLGIFWDITDKKRAEEVLRESEERYKALFEGSAEGILVADIATKQFRDANPAICKMLGYTKEELIHMSIADIHPKEALDHVICEFEAQARGEKTLAPAIPCLRKDGTIMYADINTAKILIAGREHNVGFFSDVTERKRAQEEKDKLLHDLNERMKELNCLYEMAKIIETPKISLEEIYQKIVDVMPPAWQYPDITCARITVEGQEFKTPNYKDTKWKQSTDIRTHGKKVGVVEVCYLEEKQEIDEGPFLKEERNLIEAIAERMGRITERNQAEEKIKIFSDAIASAFDYFILTDENGKFTYANESAIRAFGYTHEEFLKLNITDLDADPGIAKKVMQDIVVEGKWSGEVINIRKNKETFPSLLSAFVVKDDKGNQKGAMGILRDITERKRAEENLRKAKKEAEEANRLKSEFLANMSHEIRTPMNAIIGMTDLTLDTELTDEQREYLKTVKESGHALLGLIDDILDLSKIEAGKIELETIDFDLHALVESAADALAPRSSFKGLELACLIHHGVPTFLRGDPGRLRQILVNLGGNAIKFTEKGEVVIGVELKKETEDGATLLFSVTDTGIGIPKDKQTKIFESFTQADGSTARKYGGTGLGLSISRRLVELMDGKIGLESQPGKGSCFWFTTTLEKQKEFQHVSPTLVPADIRGKRILVVDDNKTNRTILAKMLESFGCSPEAVENGDEAVKTLERATHKEKFFDLVFLDMQMPQMDGEETLRAIKDDPEIRDVAVVMLTSVGVRGDVARLQALGCAGYLVKPIKQSQLFDMIVTVFNREKIEVQEKPLPIVSRHTIEEEKRRRIRILLTEDNPTNQKLVVALIKKAGHSADVVESGQKAMEALNRTSYDLVLMDVQMPEMDGFEATKAIREMEGENKHTPIIAMTAHAMKGDRERCLQAGMDDYVSKPIEPKKLFETIKKWTQTPDPKKASLWQERSQKSAGLKNSPLDFDDALAKLDNDKALLEEMLREFLDSAPSQLKILDEAAKNGDAEMVEKEAHSLKGAAANLSAHRVADIALKLELLGREKDLSGAKEIIGNLKAELTGLEEYSNQLSKEKITMKS
jgi:two-component system sensor histidine kinase/response regulator